MISDIHFDFNGQNFNNLTITKNFLSRVISTLNELEPTFVVIAGDFINFSINSLAHLKEYLLKIKCEKVKNKIFKKKLFNFFYFLF